MRNSLFLCAVLLVASSSAAFGQATRTWVSGVGDDANPCSRTAPCKTFAGAISKTAAGGYINVIDPGGYGAVTITKSITIDGTGAQAGILATAGTQGILVNAAATDVVILRHLSIEGAGTGANGVRVMSAKQVHVEDCTIQDFSTNGILSNGATHLFVTRTTIKDIPSQGIYVQNGRATIDRVWANGNGVGVLAGSGGVVTVKNSVASGNEIGFGAAYSSSSVINIEDSVTANNYWGVLAGTSGKARLSNVSVFSNSSSGLYNDGTGTILSFGNNRFAGNTADGSFTGTVSVK